MLTVSCAFHRLFHALPRNVTTITSSSVTEHNQLMIFFGFVFYLQHLEFLLEPFLFFNLLFILHVSTDLIHISNVSFSFFI